MNQKGQALIFLLIGIIVLAAIGGAFYLGRSITPKPSPTPTATSQVNPSLTPSASPTPIGAGDNPVPNGTGETTNWKTYTKLGYEIKYPQSSVVTEFSLDPSMPDLLSRTSTEIKVDGRQAPISFFVYVWSNLGVNIINSESRDQWCSLLEKELIGQLECIHEGKLPSVQVNGYNAYQITGGRDSTLVKTIYIPHNNYVYELTAFIEGADGKKFPVSDQILSTFKFTP